ncbi:PLD nuclease N-terminal domain-containing protein [Streptomycetaceae bacterium NBC_01309]
MLRVAPLLLSFAVLVYAFIDCLTTDEQKVRNLPKLAWVFIVLLVPLVGAIGWFVAGRPRRDRAAERRARFVAPDDDPEFLASLGKSNKEHEDMLKRWEEDLKQHETELHDEGPEGEGDGGKGDGRKGDGRTKD